MAIEIKANQAIGFNITDESCNCGGGYCQPILTTDKTSLQGSSFLSSFLNFVSNPLFSSTANWTLGAGWSITGGKLVATNISGTTATSDPLLLTQNKLYIVSTAITVTSAGSAGVNQGFIIKVNDQTLALPGAATAYKQSLTATWLFKAGAITTDVVQFSTNESTIDFEVDYFNIYPLSEVGLAVYNGDTLVTTVTSFTGSNSLKYYFNGELFTTGSIIYSGITSEVKWNLVINDWASITNYTGCLTIRIYDTYFTNNIIRNGTFNGSINGWTEDTTTDWSYSASRAFYTYTGVTQGVLYQTFYLLGGYTYDVSFVLNLGQIKLSATYNGGSPVTLGSYTGASGTPKTATIDLTAYTSSVTVKLMFSEYAGYTANAAVDTVVVNISEPDADNVSNCISLLSSHDCTLLFSATNNDNAFGFDYTTGPFTHYLRVKAKKEVSGYPEESEEYLFSDESRDLLFARSEKEFEINVTDAPDYIHDCLRHLRLHDTFTIDGTEYVKSSNYDLRKRKSSKLKQSMFSVKEKTGIATNYCCS